MLLPPAKRRKIADERGPIPLGLEKKSAPVKREASQTDLGSLTEPQLFYRLNYIPGLSASGNEGTIRIGQIFAPGATRAILTTYKLDLVWLADVCPDILTLPTEILHGEADLEIPFDAVPSTLKIRCVKPTVAYGVFHGKIFVIGTLCDEFELSFVHPLTRWLYSQNILTGCALQLRLQICWKSTFIESSSQFGCKIFHA